MAASHQATDFDAHPLLEPFGCVLQTPSIDALCEQARRWLWTGSSGAYILGNARMGKTTALEILEQELTLRDGRSVPIHRMTVHGRDTPTIKSIWLNLNLSAQLIFNKRESSDDLAARFIMYLLERIKAVEANRVVLLIDEMQRLHLKQFQAFAEIYDRLQELKLGSLTIFMGNQEESKTLLEGLHLRRYKHIYGRFFTQKEQFHGLRSAQEVKDCLRQYDKLRYPLPKGPTYTAYFLPKAWADGWRLASLATPLWAGFREYQKTYGISSWGMHYFAITVNALLIDYLPNHGVDSVDEELITSCIDLSGLSASHVSQV